MNDQYKMKESFTLDSNLKAKGLQGNDRVQEVRQSGRDGV